MSHKFAHFRNAQKDTKFTGCLPWLADKTGQKRTTLVDAQGQAAATTS